MSTVNRIYIHNVIHKNIKISDFEDIRMKITSQATISDGNGR